MEEGKVGGCTEGRLMLHKDEKKNNNGEMGVVERTRYRKDETTPSCYASLDPYMKTFRIEP